MNSIQSLKDKKFWGLLGLGAISSIFFPFLGAPGLRVLRNVYGGFLFWLSGFVLFAGLFALGAPSVAVFLAGLWVTIGLFASFEERGQGNFWSGTLAIFLGAMIAWQGPLALDAMGLTNSEESLQKNLEVLVSRMEKDPNQKAWVDAFGLTKETLLGQVPSMLALLFLMCLAFALILDRRVAVIFGVRFERIVGTSRLLDFRVPDALIWLFLLSFLLSFWKVGPPQVSVGALNVMQYLLGVYFFQGLAVFETSLLLFRIGPFFKIIFYILFVGQLFFLLSLFGLADYWVDFRRRLRDWKLKQRKSDH